MQPLAIRQRLHNPELRAVCPNEMDVFKIGYEHPERSTAHD